MDAGDCSRVVTRKNGFGGKNISAVTTVEADIGEDAAMSEDSSDSDAIDEENAWLNFWTDVRFSDISPEDFGVGTRVYAIADLVVPSHFTGIWRNYTETSFGKLLAEDHLESLEVIVLLVNHGHDEELRLAKLLLLEATRLELSVLWIVHAAPLGASGSRMRCSSIHDLVESGLHGLVEDESLGFDLALHVRSHLIKVQMNRIVLQNAIHELQHREDMAADLRSTTAILLWQYARPRLTKHVPRVDFTISENPQKLDDYQLGDVLGQGRFGKVVMVTSQHDGIVQAMKVLRKSDMTALSDLQDLDRHILIMEILSSDRWKHKHITQFFQVYHSDTHFYFRQEFGGRDNLHRRLVRRGPSQHQHQPMSSPVALRIMIQVSTAVAHLHDGPCVIHLDVKPENVIVDDAGCETVKLTDFDTALIQRPGARCKKICGTVPFMAPEILLSKYGYDGRAADVWSLAVLLLEVQCGTNVVKKWAELEKSALPERAANRFRDLLGNEKSLRFNFRRSQLKEFQDLTSTVEQAAIHTLQVESANRWPAGCLADFLTSATLRRKSAGAADHL